MLSETEAILETVKMIDGRVGFAGLVRVQKGSEAFAIRCRNFGILSGLPRTTIERWVNDLLAEGVLVRGDNEYRLISLG